MFNTTSVGTQCTRAAAVTFTEKYCSSMWLYDFLINPLRSIKNSQALVYMFGHILSPRGQNTWWRTCLVVPTWKMRFL